MVTLIAHIDFFNPLWESQDFAKVFTKGTTKDMVTWLQENCTCDPVQEDFSKNLDDIITLDPEHIITYRDTGMIEEVKLYKK